MHTRVPLQPAYRSIFLAYTGVALLGFAGSLLCFPDAPYKFEEQRVEQQLPMQVNHPPQRSNLNLIRQPSSFTKRPITKDANLLQSLNSVTRPDTDGDGSQPAGGGVSLKQQTFFKQCLSIEMARVTAIFTAGSFWANYFIGSLAGQLDAIFMPLSVFTNSTAGAAAAAVDPVAAAAAVAAAQHSVALYTDLFNVLSPCGALALPFAGWLLDTRGFGATGIVLGVLGMLFGAAMLVAGDFSDEWDTATGAPLPPPAFVGPLLTFAFVAYSLFRTLLYTYVFAFLGHVFGFNYFGLLAGVAFAVAGAVSFMQALLPSLGSAQCINWVQVWTLSVILLIPLQKIYSARKEQQQQQQQQQQQPPQQQHGMTGHAAAGSAGPATAAGRAGQQGARVEGAAAAVSPSVSARASPRKEAATPERPEQQHPWSLRAGEQRYSMFNAYPMEKVRESTTLF